KLSNALMAGVLGARCKVVVPQPGAVEFTALALHPSGPWAAAGQSDGLVRVFDTRSWAEVTAHQWAAQPIEGLAFAPDGLKAAAGFGSEGQFVVWDVDL
ncbi:MAG TPA: WD40 repeat domain-containing protein, partial [Gemmata sp.]